MLTLLEKEMPSRVLKKTMSRDLKRISAGVSLVMLALGFSLLGILSFRNRLQGELATGSALEKNCCLAGGAGSLWQGRYFLLSPVFTGAGGRRQEWIRETQAAFDEGGDRWETVRLGRA